jgi:hypothetical protein
MIIIETGRIIPRSLWRHACEQDLLDQPGWQVWLHMPEASYLEADEWGQEMFGDDFRLLMWYSSRNPNTVATFARKEQALLFKLTWAGR